jgi:hypothetical protein
MQSPYRQNAFFLLDARADATIQEIRRLQNRAEVLLEMRGNLESGLLAFIPRNQITREDVLSGSQRLEVGQSRIKEELYWVHAGPKNDCLPIEQSSSLISFLSNLSRGTGRQAAIATHNLAVATHAFAFEQEFSKSATLQTREAAWSAALSSWRAAFTSEEFWDFISERVSSWRDPTVSDSDVQRARRDIAEELLRPHRQLAADYSARGNYDFARLHIQLIQLAGEWMPVANRYLSEISTDIVRQARTDLDAVLVGISENALTPLQNDQKRQKLGSAEEQIGAIIAKALAKLSFFGATQDSNYVLEDQVSQCLRIISIRYFNQLDDSHSALRVVTSALVYARTPSYKAQIVLDKSVIEVRSLCQLSFEFANQGKYAAAEKCLLDAKKIAPDSEAVKIEEWLATCRRNRVLEGVDTKHNSPTLRTINGIGATFYGKRDYDSGSNSYVTTHFFTFFFLPVIPLAAYRVVSAGGNSYRIFGKVPLSKEATWYRWIVLALIAIIIVYSSMQSSAAPSYESTPTSNFIPATNSTPVTPSSTNHSDETEKQELDRTRTELDSRKAALVVAEQQLDSRKRQLDSLKDEIQELEQQYPSGKMPSAVYSDYETKLDEHNRLVALYNEELADLQLRERKYDGDVTNFNQRIREYNARQ